jgi:membrane-bound lytic murein transglycosylase D
VLSSEQAELAADPSDYLVAADGTIEVQALETLGHYADWLGIRTQHLRDINGLPFGQAVVIGERLKLEFDGVDVASFEQRRVAYQQTTQEAFFRTYQISDTVEHVVRSGESLWVLALRQYRVPVWLVRQFNPDLDLDQVNPGTVVKFPELRPIVTAAEAPAQVASDTAAAPLPAE